MPIFLEKANNPIAPNQDYTLVSRAVGAFASRVQGTRDNVLEGLERERVRPWLDHPVKCHLMSGLFLIIAALSLWLSLVPESPSR